MPFPQQNIYRKWTFTDSIFSTNYKPFMWYNTTGNYQVQLEIMASNGCRDTVLSQIEISNVPEAGFIIENACLGALTTFIDTSICENCVLSLWNWTFNGLSFGANANVNYNFENIGIYEVNLKVENSAGCEHEISQNVNITALPEALFSVNSSFGSPPFELDLTNLSNNNLQFYWSFGDGSISNLFEPNYTYNDTGIFKLTLIVNDLNGCIDSASSNIQLLPKKIDVALTNVNLNNSNGYIHSEILIINLGTTTVNTFDILMSSNGNANNLVERWEGVLVPGELKQYTLRNSFKQEENYNITDYICYQIQNIDKGSDSNLANNKQCVVLNPDEFKFTSLYPNPGNENLKLSVISPFSDNITIDFIDYTGALVLSINQKVTVGFNLLNVETFTLADGVYKCRINSRNNYFIQNFVKIKN